jgi:hypothetical protein
MNGVNLRDDKLQVEEHTTPCHSFSSKKICLLLVRKNTTFVAASDNHHEENR